MTIIINGAFINPTKRCLIPSISFSLGSRALCRKPPMNCFSAVSLLSLLPGCIQSLLPLPHNPSSIWGGEEGDEEETERPSERVASDTTTLYTYPGIATYRMNKMVPPISKSPTALSKLQQIESERPYIAALPSISGNIQLLQSFYRYGRSGMLRTFFLQRLPISLLPAHPPAPPWAILSLNFRIHLRPKSSRFPQE